ncbi:hypothetical protein [Streptacidiphilus sp. EB129]|uniref:hypothetical protein n=1 Tax=Streptacidiphilus sp. EB129 TaxID=3156262 RepID=UPI003514ECCD
MKSGAMKSRVGLVAVSALGGGLFGLATSLIPSPSGVGVLWVGNLASPWLALAFLCGWACGWAQRSRLWASASGVAAEVACVVGFYGRFLLVDQHPGPRGQHTALPARVSDNLGQWLVFIAPWVLAALAAGTAYGLIGHLWGRGRRLPAGLALGMPFLAEPWVWREALGYDQGSWLLCAAETAVGVAIVLAVLAAWRRASRAPSPHTA